MHELTFEQLNEVNGGGIPVAIAALRVIGSVGGTLGFISFVIDYSIN